MPNRTLATDTVLALLAEERPTIRAVNPRTWIKKANYPDLEFRPSLRAFAKQRANLLALLEGLPPDGWSRPATVTRAGRPLEWTVLSYAQRMAEHERPHIKHFQRTVTAVHG